MTLHNEGGYLPGSGAVVTVLIEDAGFCPTGHRLYRLDGVEQHLISADEVRAGDTSQLDCQRALEALG